MGECWDLLVLRRRRTKTPCLLTAPPANLEWPATFFGLSFPSLYGSQFLISAEKHWGYKTSGRHFTFYREEARKSLPKLIRSFSFFQYLHSEGQTHTHKNRGVSPISNWRITLNTFFIVFHIIFRRLNLALARLESNIYYYVKLLSIENFWT